MQRFKFQLQDRPLGGVMAGPAIIGSGGVALVTPAGSPLKATLFDKAGASLANPISLTRGSGEFYTANSVEEVDLFIMCPDGQFVSLFSVRADELHDVPVDRSRIDQHMIVPIHVTNFPATVETDTGFDITALMGIMPIGVAVQTTTVDAGITLDAGTDGAGSNDPNGFVEASSVASAVIKAAVLTNAAKDLGALLFVQDSANAGDEVPSMFVDAATENLTVTLSAGADTFQGYLHLPYKNYTRNQPTL